jgi:hypothetical protein
VGGEVLDIKTSIDEAAPFGSAQRLKRKQHESPKVWLETGSDDEGILLLRARVIESAGEPRYRRT